MPDLAIDLTATGVDLRLEGGDLVISETLLEPVLVSIFSDARAPGETELPDDSGDPRGWWGETTGETFGSLLWLLERAPLVQQTAVLARGHVRQALDWMIRGEIASAVEVETSIERDDLGAGYMAIRVGLHRGTSSAWEIAWEATREMDWSAARWRLNLLLR